VSQARWSFLLKRMCVVLTTKKRCSGSLIVKLSTLWYVGFQSFFFLSYFFLEFDEFIFSFQETYSNRLKERYEDDLLTHSDINPDLWLEVGSFDGPNGNQVYRLSNTTTENLRTTLSALTVRCSQSIMSIQTPKFTAILDQWIQDRTTHLNDKYERLTANYE
jgi:hypothetical protein